MVLIHPWRLHNHDDLPLHSSSPENVMFVEHIAIVTTINNHMIQPQYNVIITYVISYLLQLADNIQSYLCAYYSILVSDILQTVLRAIGSILKRMHIFCFKGLLARAPLTLDASI